MGEKQLSVRLPSELASKVKVKAWSRGLSVTAVVTRLLEDWAQDVDLHPDSLVPARPATVVPPADEKKESVEAERGQGQEQRPEAPFADSPRSASSEPTLEQLLADRQVAPASSFRPDPKPQGKKR